MLPSLASSIQFDFGSAPGISPAADAGVSMLVYRSRAVGAPSERELEVLVRKAQQRNRAEGLTGLLIYDQGCFFQWLEGPQAALARVWESIQRDPRHREIQLLREQAIPKRFFGAWDMRLAQRAALPDDGFGLVDAQGNIAGRRFAERVVLTRSVWDDIFADLVVPRLKARYQPGRAPTAMIWHAHDEAPLELAGFLRAVDAAEASRFLNGLVAQGAGLDAMYREVFEPAARYLGGLCDDERRGSTELTLVLARLQFEARRLSAALSHPRHAIKPGHTVLIAPQPGEAHGMNAAMSSELFWRDGWDVSCEYPSSDHILRELVHERWFDVLDLSLSGAVRREHELQRMGVSIRAAQAASLNPALAVVVHGRTFFEDPHAFFGIGADAGCISVAESIAAAERLLGNLATQDRIEQAMSDGARRVPTRTRPLSLSI